MWKGLSTIALIASGLIACQSVESIDDRTHEPGSVEFELLAPVQDAWLPAPAQPAITLRSADSADFSPVHATLMPDGRVVFLGLKKGTAPVAGAKAGIITPTPLGQALPTSVTIDDQAVPLDADAALVDNQWIVDDTPFCAGQTLLADGSLFIAGGTRTVSTLGGGLIYILGLSYATVFDGAQWTRVAADMTGVAEQGDPLRWYPTTTRLDDGRILVTSGRDYVATMQNGQFIDVGTENLSAEIYDPATGGWTLVSPYGQTPASIFNPDYTHVFQLPYDTPFDVLMFGAQGTPVFMDPIGPTTWVEAFKYRPDTLLSAGNVPLESPNEGASSVMLPIRLVNNEWGYFNGSVLVAGGTHFRPHEQSVDVYDPIVNAWQPRRDMEVRRHHPATVILPDGQILIMTGHDDVTSDPRVGNAQYVDPANGFAISEGTSQLQEIRGYHTIALLLPDGRVLMAGGRTGGPDVPDNEQPSMRYYHPPYMDDIRPAITAAPDVINYNAGFVVTWTGPTPTEAVLVGLGSMTHSVDMNQRYVQIMNFATDPQQQYSILVGPPDAQTAPPGHYMLFLLDANRVPSVAKIVKVE